MAFESLPPSSLDPNVLSDISHKLRTPLTVIMSTANNLLDGAYGGLAPEQKKWIEKLSTHTLNLETLITELMTLLKNSGTALSTIRSDGSSLGFRPGTGVLAPLSSAVSANILVVDDEPDILDVMKEGLSSQGYRITTANNGDDALALALEQPPDLLLMDVLLGRQNGMELAGRIRERLPGFTPVIIITGQDDLREKIAPARDMADDILTKPFQMEELFARVRSMVRLKRLSDKVAGER